jgi:hypothetical protein
LAVDENTGSGYGGVVPALQNLDPTNQTVHPLVVSRTGFLMLSGFTFCGPDLGR